MTVGDGREPEGVSPEDMGLDGCGDGVGLAEGVVLGEAVMEPVTALAVSLLRRTVMPPVETSGLRELAVAWRTRSVVPSLFMSPVEMEVMLEPARRCCSGFELPEPKVRLPRLRRMATR